VERLISMLMIVYHPRVDRENGDAATQSRQLENGWKTSKQG
jgi:hypothetical protein